MIDPVVAVKTLLLQEAMPDLVLRPGSSVVARVASRTDQHGVLVLAGVPLTAQLPDEVQAGATLRLKVTDVTAERVTMQLDGPPLMPPGMPPPPAPPARVGVEEPPRRSRQGGEDLSSVVLAFESTALGRLDLRIDLSSAAVQVTVGARAGEAHEVAAAAAGRLRDALNVSVEREATVVVRPRHEPVDVYA